MATLVDTSFSNDTGHKLVVDTNARSTGGVESQRGYSGPKKGLPYTFRDAYITNEKRTLTLSPMTPPSAQPLSSCLISPMAIKRYFQWYPLSNTIRLTSVGTLVVQSDMVVVPRLSDHSEARHRRCLEFGVVEGTREPISAVLLADLLDDVLGSEVVDTDLIWETFVSPLNTDA